MFGLLKRPKLNVININDIDDLMGKINLIDIREPYEYKSGSLKTAKNIPMSKLLNDHENYLQMGKKYYIYCQSGARSMRAVAYLSKLGYDVVNISGGIGSYVGTNRK